MLQDVAAERAVLTGIWLHHLDAFSDVNDLVTSDTFTVVLNEVIYKAFHYLFETKGLKKLDKSSLYAAINELGFSYIWQNKDDIDHVKTIVEGNISLENVRPWAAKIKKLEIARNLEKECKQIIKDMQEVTGDEEISQIVGIAENKILDFSVSQAGGKDIYHIGDNLDEYIRYLKENSGRNLGISSGYPLFDQSIGGGFRRKTVSLIGARAKCGKSTLATCISLFIAGRLQIPVLFLDSEMDIATFWARIIPNIIRRLDNQELVSINDFERWNVNNEADVLDACRRVKLTKLFYRNIAGCQFEEVLSIIRRFIYKNVGFTNGRANDCLIIYDYLKVLNDKDLKGNVSEHQKIGFLLTDLNNLCIKYDVPILAFTQLNRDGVNVEDSTALSGSDRLSWYSANVSLYKEKTPEEIAENPNSGNRKLIPILARHGEGLPPGDYICFNFEKKYSYIQEVDTRYNLEDKKRAANKPMVEMQDNEIVNAKD